MSWSFCESIEIIPSHGLHGLRECPVLRMGCDLRSLCKPEGSVVAELVDKEHADPKAQGRVLTASNMRRNEIGMAVFCLNAGMPK